MLQLAVLHWCLSLCHAALEGAEHIVFEGAKHVPLDKPEKGHWYGSGPYLEEWIGVLHPEASALTSSSSSSANSSIGSS
jgi:hypothetical protein